MIIWPWHLNPPTFELRRVVRTIQSVRWFPIDYRLVLATWTLKVIGIPANILILFVSMYDKGRDLLRILGDIMMLVTFLRWCQNFNCRPLIPEKEAKERRLCFLWIILQLPILQCFYFDHSQLTCGLTNQMLSIGNMGNIFVILKIL